jgi:DMSO reductase anchor subunit
MEWTAPWFVIKDVIPVDASLVIGTLGVIMSLVLFVSTAMIYASLRFLQEWHSPLTVANFIFFGLASGFTMAAAFSAWTGVDLVGFYGTWAVVFTVISAITRGFSMLRNSKIKHKSTMKTALGIRHTKITQRSMGFMGGSFNTKEYFHGASDASLAAVRMFFMLAVFAIPVALLAASNAMGSSYLPLLAFVVQYVGLVAERWYFFTEGKHPQNLYYQTVG